jgi:hypothetical protein
MHGGDCTRKRGRGKVEGERLTLAAVEFDEGVPLNVSGFVTKVCRKLTNVSVDCDVPSRLILAAVFLDDFSSHQPDEF